MAGFGDKPYGLREIRLVRDGTVVVMPVARKLGFSERIQSDELRGDDRLAALVGFAEGVEWELEAGGISLESLAVMTGRSALSSGTGQNRKLRINGKGGQGFPYFQIFGKSVGDAGDDIHVKLGACKLTELSGEFSDGGFLVTDCSGIAVDDGSGIYQFVQNETAKSINTGVAPSGPATAYSWTMTTWAVDDNGYAYNTPTLGPELFLNGSFAADANWTKGAGWTISGGVAVANAATGDLTQSISLSGPHQLRWKVASITAGTVKARTSAYTLSGGGIGDPGEYLVANEWSSALSAAGLRPSGFTGTVDDLSLRAVTNADTFALVQPGAVDSVSVRLGEQADMIQAGIVMCADNLTNPNNYIFARRIAHYLNVVKVVGGVMSAVWGADYIPFERDARLELRRIAPTTFQLWYNGAQAGPDMTIDDAGIINNTIHGMRSLAPGARLGEFAINGTVIPFNF